MTQAAGKRQGRMFSCRVAGLNGSVKPTAYLGTNVALQRRGQRATADQQLSQARGDCQEVRDGQLLRLVAWLLQCKVHR